jgi:hypothetical protein
MPRLTRSSRSDLEQGFRDDAGDLREAAPEQDVGAGAEESRASSMRRPGEGPLFEELLRWATRSLAALAVLSSFALLCVGAPPLLTSLSGYVAAFRDWVLVKHVPLAGLPLLLAGFSYIVLQVILRPRPLELLKRLMLGAAFLLWGVVQLMPVSELATELGNLVVALYVIDLGLMIWTDLQKHERRPVH